MSNLSSDPAGWIAFEVAAGVDTTYWLETNNSTGGIINVGWDYPWDAAGGGPETKHFSQIKSIGTKVERDYAGINSSGGPQVAGRADHAEIEVVKESDVLTPILYQFVSTAEAFSSVLIVLPEYGGKPRVEWLLKGVNLTLFEFSGTRSNAASLRYTPDTKLENAKSISSEPTSRYYLRVDKMKLLYTSAEIRVGAGVNSLSVKTDFRGWDTGSNTRILSYPSPPSPPPTP